jgi:hypothetical protein
VTRRTAAPQAGSAPISPQDFPLEKPAPQKVRQASTKISRASQSSEAFDRLNENSGKAYFYTLARAFQTKIHG